MARECGTGGEGGLKQEKEVEPRDGKRKGAGCEKNVSVVKFSRQPTDETNDGSMPG
jgi:hypothetical protein